MGRIIRIIAFGSGLAGGIVASQGPEFSQQYRQRLGGGIDALREVIARFESDAQAFGETSESAIARLRGNADALVGRQGAAMEETAQRLRQLQAHRQAMIEAGPFRRIGLMVRQGDRDVMGAAYRDFEPAVPVTGEGVVSAALGFGVVWGSILLLAGLLRTLFRSRRRAAVRA